MRPLALVLVTAALVAAACGGNGEPRAETTGAPATTTNGEREVIPPPPTFGRGTVVIRTDGREIEVDVEIAETDAQRQFGLMFRKFLPDESGMVFVFPDDTSGGFWMKNTLIPLSIAFYDGEGRILRILDMEPCAADPCPVYDPGVEYRGALEVNRGALERWGVEDGDLIELRRS